MECKTTLSSRAKPTQRGGEVEGPESWEPCCLVEGVPPRSLHSAALYAPRKPLTRKRGFRTAIQGLLVLSPLTRTLRPEIDIGSGFQPPARGLPARPPLKTSPRAGFPGASGPGDVHAAACGLLMKGLRPLHTSPGLCLQSGGCLTARQPFSYAEKSPCRRGGRGTEFNLEFCCQPDGRLLRVSAKARILP